MFYLFDSFTLHAIGNSPLFIFVVIVVIKNQISRELFPLFQESQSEKFKNLVSKNEADFGAVPSVLQW